MSTRSRETSNFPDSADETTRSHLLLSEILATQTTWKLSNHINKQLKKNKHWKKPFCKREIIQYVIHMWSAPLVAVTCPTGKENSNWNQCYIPKIHQQIFSVPTNRATRKSQRNAVKSGCDVLGLTLQDGWENMKAVTSVRLNSQRNTGGSSSIQANTTK